MPGAALPLEVNGDLVEALLTLAAALRACDADKAAARADIAARRAALAGEGR